jgi:galactose oxidase
MLRSKAHSVRFLCAEIWDPATEKFTVLAKMAVPRTYHSVALLMRDGRVFVAGGGLCGGCGTNHFDGQIFSPPNLFQADGKPAVQPTVTISKAILSNGESFVVTANKALSTIALVRFGSATHAVNTDQRRIELCGKASKACAAAAGNKYTVTIPARPGIVIPGNWMVFGVDAAGVPSKSAGIKVGSAKVGPLSIEAFKEAPVENDLATTAPVQQAFAATPADADGAVTPLPPGETLH